MIKEAMPSILKESVKTNTLSKARNQVKWFDERINLEPRAGLREFLKKLKQPHKLSLIDGNLHSLIKWYKKNLKKSRELYPDQWNQKPDDSSLLFDKLKSKYGMLKRVLEKSFGKPKIFSEEFDQKLPSDYLCSSQSSLNKMSSRLY